jgi:hypothetical protein
MKLKNIVIIILRKLMYFYYSVYFKLFKLPKLIFVISTMRSYTSVFSHILGSHKDILGKGERHLKYGNLKYKDHIFECLFQKRSFFPRYRFILDNVNWDGQEPMGEFLDSKKDNAKIIFLLRNPNDTLASIIKRGGLNWYDISNYYLKRLQSINILKDKLTNKSVNYLYIEAEGFILNRDKYLNKISKYLGLKSTLIDSYKTDKLTGHSGYSDDSKNIFSKKLLDRPVIHEEIKYDISEHLKLYNNVTAQLSKDSV